MAPPDELLTVRELADRWSLTTQRVDAMIRDGLPLADRSRPRRVSLRAAEAFRDGHTGADGRGGRRPGAGRRKADARPAAPTKPMPAASEPPQASPEPAPDSLAWLKREKARLERDELERKAQVRRGELVPIGPVRQALVEHAQRCRRQLERHVVRVTNRILSEMHLPKSSRSQLEKIISEDVAQQLRELATLPPMLAPEGGVP